VTPNEKVICVKHFRRDGRVIRVVFFRNQGGSVAGRLLLGRNDTPILDGPTPDAVMDLARDVWDALVMVRASAA
jgi:hypothetical protein